MDLYDSPFSPFARKVRLVLEHKKLEFVSVDALTHENRERLRRVNPRLEVPTLVDDELVVVGSADIVAYLEHRYPQAPVYPSDPADRARARAWERCADTTIDPILVNISYWMWAERPDSMPAGLLDAARADLDQIYARLDLALSSGRFVVGDEPTIADLGLFPHLAGARSLNVGFTEERHPSLLDWYKRMRKLPICAADLGRAKAYLTKMMAAGGAGVERRKLFWRGERIEWMLARGYHDWFMKEIAEDRVLWPGLNVPA